MNTGRSHSYKVLTYGRANTLDASIKKALLKLVQGLCSRYREQRDIAAMQLNQAVNPAGHAELDFDSLMLHHVADGILAPMMVPAFKASSIKWAATRQPRHLAQGTLEDAAEPDAGEAHDDDDDDDDDDGYCAEATIDGLISDGAAGPPGGLGAATLPRMAAAAAGAGGVGAAALPRAAAATAGGVGVATLPRVAAAAARARGVGAATLPRAAATAAGGVGAAALTRAAAATAGGVGAAVPHRAATAAVGAGGVGAAATRGKGLRTKTGRNGSASSWLSALANLNIQQGTGGRRRNLKGVGHSLLGFL